MPKKQKRKSPIKHRVKAHEREDGSTVKAHSRGSGTGRVQRKATVKRISKVPTKVFSQKYSPIQRLSYDSGLTVSEVVETLERIDEYGLGEIDVRLRERQEHGRVFVEDLEVDVSKVVEAIKHSHGVEAPEDVLTIVREVLEERHGGAKWR